jgi:pimeloyl-ACP methyl ester carboxylesterase
MGCMKPKLCHKSGEVLTSEEAGRYALIPFDPTNPDESNDLSKNHTVYSYTPKCFKEVSTLDFSRTYDIVQPTSEFSGINFVMVHGGGASRQMYQAHAKILANKGHRSILLDLPGHGTLADTKLTLESCAETVKSVLDENTDSLKLTKANTVYVGASFGAYTGF